MMCGKRLLLKLKVAVYKSYVRSAMLYANEAWCLKGSGIGILWTERSMVRAMCGVQLIGKKRARVNADVGFE